MANWSDTEISLIGAKIDEAKEYFNSFVKDDGCGPYSDTQTKVKSKIINEIMSIDEMIMIDGCLIINGCGKWYGPLYFIKYIARKFKLTGSYFDREIGNNFTHLMMFEDGKCVLNEEDLYLSQLAFDNCSNLRDDAYYIVDSEDPEIEYPEELKLFLANGITLDDLKEYHGVA